jgi:hypothetical protein
MCRQGANQLLASIIFQLSFVVCGRGIFTLFKCVETQRFLCTCVWGWPIKVVSSGSYTDECRKGRLRDRSPMRYQIKSRSLAYLWRILITHESEACSLRFIPPHALLEINLQVA